MNATPPLSETEMPVKNPSRIDTAAQILFEARVQPRDRLAENFRPQSLEEAEAVQHSVLAKAQERIGGWKVGRIDDFLYSALLPRNSITSELAGSVVLPAGVKIELELATRFREALGPPDVERITLADLPSITDCVALFEFVRSRFKQGAMPSALEKIADNVSTVGIVTGQSIRHWALDTLRNPCATLHESGLEVAEHEGPHPSEPLEQLFDAWKRRCIQEDFSIEPGQLITWGSLSGVRLVPPEGADYIGRIGGASSIQCRPLMTPFSAGPEPIN